MWITVNPGGAWVRPTQLDRRSPPGQENTGVSWGHSAVVFDKHIVVLVGLMSWHRMSHDAPRLHNDIKHYSRLMLLLLLLLQVSKMQSSPSSSASCGSLALKIKKLLIVVCNTLVTECTFLLNLWPRSGEKGGKAPTSICVDTNLNTDNRYLKYFFSC